MSTASKRSSESSAGKQDDAKKQKYSTNQQYEVTHPNHVQNHLDRLKHSDPVLQLHLHNDKKDLCTPDIKVSSQNLLKAMMYPLSPQDFKSTCFRKKAVHIRSDRSDRARDISMNYMFGLDSRQIFEETSSDSVFLWIPSSPSKNQSDGDADGDGDDPKSEKYLQSIDIQDPNTANILHQNSNYASYCRAPPELEQPLVSSMLRDVGLGLGQYDPTGDKLTTLGRGEVETFIGTKGHLTNWHTDFQENFTIQLSGRKKWTLKQGTVKHPIRGTTPHYKSSDDVIENQIKVARLSNPDYQFGKQDLESNAFGNEVEIIMNAGDILYFPAGMWHKVETLEYGVSINISLMGSTYASLVCKTLEHMLLQKEDWREVICSNEGTGNDVVNKLQTLLNDLPSIVNSFGDVAGSSILPPVLRKPPVFTLMEENHESEEIDSINETGSDAIVDDDDSLVEETDIPINQDQNSPSNGDREANDMSDSFQEEDGHVVDINEFELPEEFESATLSKKKWRMNPLASLMRMIDVKSFFEESGGLSEDTNTLFILNLNFAGNEMHESAVRVILRDKLGLLEKLCCLQGQNLDDAIQNMKAPPTALIYYGLLV